MTGQQFGGSKDKILDLSLAQNSDFENLKPSIRQTRDQPLGGTGLRRVAFGLRWSIHGSMPGAEPDRSRPGSETDGSRPRAETDGSRPGVKPRDSGSGRRWPEKHSDAGMYCHQLSRLYV